MNHCDSLGFPLKTTPRDVAIEELTPYADLSFFGADSILHTEVAVRPFGFAATSTPFRLRHDGWSGLVLLVCLLLMAHLAIRVGKRLPALLREVFLPVLGKRDEPLVDDPLCYTTRLVAVTLLSLSAAMLSFSYTQHDVGFYLFREAPYVLFGVLFLLWMLYFLLKRVTGSFVGWVFFSEGKIFTWKRVYTFLLVLESWLFFVVALVAVYLPVSAEVMFCLGVIIVFFVRILHLFKTYQIFFPKLYGTLHLFLYFCSLEVVPLLFLWQVLLRFRLLPGVNI